MSSWVFVGDAFSEKAGFKNLQAPATSTAQSNTSKIICKKLSEEFVEICQRLKIEELPEIGVLKPGDLASFALAVQDPIKTFTNPERFKKITYNPEKLVRRLGFEAVDQLSKVKPGPVLVVKWVRLDELKNFQNGNDPDKFMRFGNRIIVPLILPENNETGEQALSSLTFGMFGDEPKWRWTRRGAPQRIRKIYKYRKDSQELWEIPELNLRFIKQQTNGTIKLTPLYDAKFEGLELQVGVEQPANQIFAGLVPVVKKMLIELEEGKRPLLR
jgi:hypothetical protein